MRANNQHSDSVDLVKDKTKTFPYPGSGFSYLIYEKGKSSPSQRRNDKGKEREGLN